MAHNDRGAVPSESAGMALKGIWGYWSTSPPNKCRLAGKAHGFRGNLDTSAEKSAKNQALPAMSDRLVVLPGKPSSRRIARAASR